MKAIILIVSSILLSACSHSIHLVHVSDFEQEKPITSAKKIEVESKQHVIFWFAFDTNYVEKAKSELIEKCPSGEIKNITTRYSTSHGFFSWYNKIHMQGYCYL